MPFVYNNNETLQGSFYIVLEAEAENPVIKKTETYAPETWFKKQLAHFLNEYHEDLQKLSGKFKVSANNF